MEYDRNGLEILSRQECLRLLATAHVGRIAVSMNALPVVLPVNYCLLDGDIVIRTGPGSKLDAATNHAVVAFEVDSFSPFDHTGWSVLVQGVAREIVEADALARAERLPLRAWAGTGLDRLVRIRAQLVSGRRLATARHAVGVSAGVEVQQ